jgi:hypothetical protein
MTANRADAYHGEGANMKKITGSNKFRIVFFILLLAASMIWTSLPAHAVGPYFENESPASGQLQGPNPGWPRPDEPLWSSPAPQYMSIQSLKKGDIILRGSKQAAVPEPAAPQVKDTNTNTNQQVALR